MCAEDNGYGSGHQKGAYSHADTTSSLSVGLQYGPVSVSDNAILHQGDKYCISRETYRPNGAHLQSILDIFMQGVGSGIEKELVEVKNVDGLHESLREIQREQAKEKALRSMVRIEAFIECLHQYDNTIRKLEQVSSDVLASLWGPLQFLITCAATSGRALDAVLNIVERIGQALPQFEDHAHAFATNASGMALLPLFYKDILDFYATLLKFFYTRGWKVFFDCLWPHYEKVFNIIVQNIHDHKQLLCADVTLTDVQEAKHRSSEALREHERSCSARDKEDFESCEAQLNPRSFDMEVQALQATCCATTCDWLARDAVYRSWLRSQSPLTSIIWLCGIPGAGKSHLAAKAVETLKRSGSNVLSIFLNYRQSEHTTWISVMHSMIFQLLYDDKQLRPTFLAAYEKTRDLRLSPEENKDLLLKLLSCFGHAYIVLDGLDEIPEKARKDVLAGLIQLVGQCDGLRLLCSSREELDIVATMKAKALTLRVDQKNLKDIQTYFNTFLASWLQSFEHLDEIERRDLELKIAAVPAKAQGMFLYARLVVEHLELQDDLYSIKHEVEHLPQGLDEVYERILERTTKISPHGRSILGWMACSGVPLRTEEILHTLMINENDPQLNYDRRPYKDIRHFCGPIIEVRGDFVHFVHFSAREYLFNEQRTNGQWLDPLSVERSISMTMLTYFLLPNLDASSDEANLHARIVRGDFVLFTYALSTWLDYIRRLCLRSEKSPLLTQLSGRLEQVFVRRAAEPPDLTKEPPKINKHMSAETQRKIAEEQRVRTLVEQIVKSVKGVPEFLSVVGINKWVYHTLCQVAMAGAAGLKPGKDWHPLTLPSTWSKYQQAYDSMLCTGDVHETSCSCSKLEKLYGANLFKCEKLECQFSRLGFSSAAARKRHMAMHDAKFKCPLPECKWRQPFGSQKQLETHTALFHLNEKVKDSKASAAVPALNGIDLIVIEQMTVDAIETSNADVLEICLPKMTRPPLNALMALAYLNNPAIRVLKVLRSSGAQLEDCELIESLGSKFELAGFPFIQQTIQDLSDETGLGLHKPVSALTLAIAGSSASAVEWLICQGKSVSEQKTTRFDSRPLDYLFTLQLVRTRTPGKRKPLPLEIIKLLLDAGAPVKPGQAMVDLCSTQFIKAHDEAYCRAAEMMVENGAVFRSDAAWTIQKTSKSVRLHELAVHNGSDPVSNK